MPANAIRSPALLTDKVPRNNWGPWFRQTEARAKKGDVLMTGLNGSPLLVLSHVGEGRIALIFIGSILAMVTRLWRRRPAGRFAQTHGALAGGRAGAG